MSAPRARWPLGVDRVEAWRVCVLTVRVRGAVTWKGDGVGTLAGCRDLLRRLRG